MVLFNSILQGTAIAIFLTIWTIFSTAISPLLNVSGAVQIH